MRDKELYQQKKQAQLDELKAEIAKLKAKASLASADAQLELNKQIRAFETHWEENKLKLSELAAAGEGAWESLMTGIESAWTSLKSKVSDTVAKLK